MTTPMAALITLIECSAKLCFEYFTILKTPSMINQKPNPTKTAERKLKNFTLPYADPAISEHEVP